MTAPISSPQAAPRAIRKRSVAIAGHRTSVSLEQAFWDALRAIAAGRGVPLARLIAEVDRANARLAGRTRAANLSSALRVYVLERIKGG
ncbi:MAG: ribbon-helix-helix domain-containing protein [Rhodospirillales bacterium]